MHVRQLLHLTLALAAASTPALAQGSDVCTSPTPIAGIGVHAFNSTSATTGTQGQPLCGIPAGSDIWFVWTAPSTATYSVSTCGQAGFDTMLAAYAGAACPTSGALACNDDACGLQTTIAFATTAGASYVIQLGTYGGGGGGSGTFTIDVAVPCAASTGPDVIVGDITGPTNYNPTGGLDAISLGTDSCNLGDVWLNWFAGTNQHPVIGGNLYRYRVQAGSGRFEQIGQSWLKHGFYALSGNLCCTNCNATDGTHLGVGCSDPYSAERNGSQSGLGPRWQVNASTGAFTYPPANPGWSGSTARRVEFAQADVDTSPGVRYFGESQYVTPDDAAAGNQNNNASWREMTASGGNFAFSGTTHREDAAIEAWPLCEPGVSRTDVQVAGDGLFQVAWRVTPLGGGQYHYEYLVHNLNSHRSGGTFSIPVGAATITNVGFHGVLYRNGDGPSNIAFDGADWTATNAGGTLTWATQPEGTNVRANALRWGTGYNFRFDADVAPVAGTGTIGLWRAGSPASAIANVEVPGGATSIAFCFGDGTGTACPCANHGTAGNGCASSLNANGAHLGVAGTPSISADTFTLLGNGMPNSSALYFQGTSQVSGGAGAAFGDGKRCAGGSIRRLGTQLNAGGASQYPEAGDPAVSIGGANAAGDVRTYQVWYRNAAAFCTSDTFNLTNGHQVTWGP